MDINKILNEIESRSKKFIPNDDLVDILLNNNFSLDKNRGIIELIEAHGFTIGEDISQYISPDKEKRVLRNSNTTFEMLNIPVGSELIYFYDNSIKAKTVDNKNKIQLSDGTIGSISKITQQIEISRGHADYPKQGARYWTFNGRLLVDIREDAWGRDERKNNISENEDDIELNETQIVEYFRNKAENGDAWAQLNLGHIYENGIGIERNKDEALKWYKKASEQGSKIAQFILNKEKSLKTEEEKTDRNIEIINERAIVSDESCDEISINNTSEMGLIEAAEHDNLEQIKINLEMGCDVDSVDNWNRTALMIASGHGKLDIVKKLIQAGADMNLIDNEDRTALISAILTGHADVVEELINAGATIQINDKKLEWGNVPILINAIEKGYWKIAKKLVASFINLNAIDVNRKTALMWAIDQKNFNLLNAFIKLGADVNATNEKGWTALMFASRDGLLDAVISLIHEGANVNVSNQKQWTALMLASYNNNLDIIKELINNGGDIHFKNKFGFTALYLSKTWELFQWFINEGKVKFDIKKEGKLALMVASMQGHTDVIKNLIQCGVDINAKNNQGMTALMFASHYARDEKYYRSIIELIKAGADIAEVDNNGRTAIDYANDKTIKAILEQALEEQKNC